MKHSKFSFFAKALKGWGKSVQYIQPFPLFKLKQTCLSFLIFVMLLLQPFPSMAALSHDDAIKSCHIYKKDENGCFIFDFFGSDLSKMDQT